VDAQPQSNPEIAQDGAQHCSVTARSIAIGAALIPLLCLWVVECEILWYSCEPTTVSLMPHVVFILFFLTLGNLLVARWFPGAALNPGELLTIYVMMSIASVVCGHDSIEILVPMMSHAFWGAQANPNWAEKIHPYLRDFVTVRDIPVLRGFYEGGSSMYRWEVIAAWGRPMLSWASFIFALVGSLFLINCILRKQWTENEKLSYPVIQIPLELVTQTRQLLGSRLIWYGFALAAGIDLVNGLAQYIPAIPEIPIVHFNNLREYFKERPWNAIGQMWFSLYPFAIGVCFFLPVDMAFSCWFFFLFWQAQRVVASAMGVILPGFPFVNDQTAGGYLALCVIALWVSRRHLKEVFLHLIGSRKVDDSAEALPYRLAALLLAACLVYVGIFLHWLGMSVWLVFPFLLIYLAIAVAIARMRAELGPPAHDLHYAGPDQMMMRFGGMGNLGPQNLAALAMTWFFNRAYRGQPIAPSLEGLKIAQQTRMSARRMLLAMVVALALGTFSGFWGMLHVGYKHGMAASVIGPGQYFGIETYERLYSFIAEPQKPNTGATIATAVGTTCALGLAALRMRFVWWPFHPVGYAVSGSWSMEQLWFPMFISWLLKWVILRYGGAKAYRRAIPFFIGLVLGDFVVGCYWILHGVVLGIPTYHFWPY